MQGGISVTTTTQIMDIVKVLVWVATSWSSNVPPKCTVYGFLPHLPAGSRNLPPCDTMLWNREVSCINMEKIVDGMQDYAP